MENDIELKESEKGSKDGVIQEFFDKNNLSLMDLEMFLNCRGLVCMTKEEYYELADTE